MMYSAPFSRPLYKYELTKYKIMNLGTFQGSEHKTNATKIAQF